MTDRPKRSFRTVSALAAGAIAILVPFLVGALVPPATAAEPGRGRILRGEEAHAWRGVGRVNIGGFRTHGLCTGVLIAPDIVLTAAHCVVHPRTGKPHRLGSIHFVAGWRKGEMTGHSVAAALSVHPFYRANRDDNALALTTDVALIRLLEPLAPEAAEPFEVAAPPQPGTPILVVSYRRDRPNALTYQNDCSFKMHQGPVMLLDCPITFGASGAPVFAEVDGEHRVIGTLIATDQNGLAFAIQTKGAVDNLLKSFDDPAAPDVAN